MEEIMHEDFEEKRFEQYFPNFSGTNNVPIENLALDLYNPMPKLNNNFALKKLKIEKINESNDELLKFITKEGETLISLQIHNACPSESGVLLNILTTIPDLTSLEMQNISGKSFDVHCETPILNQLRVLKLDNVNSSKILQILDSIKLNEINIKKLNVDDDSTKYLNNLLVKQKTLKKFKIKNTDNILSILFGEQRNVTFKLTTLEIYSFEAYSKMILNNFIDFIIHQNDLVNICVSIRMKEPEEFKTYFEYVLNLQSSESLTIFVESVEECTEYLKTCEIVNRRVKYLTVVDQDFNNFTYVNWALLMNIFPKINFFTYKMCGYNNAYAILIDRPEFYGVLETFSRSNWFLSELSYLLNFFSPKIEQ